MKRLYLVIVGLIAFGLVGIALGQDTLDDSFAEHQVIGRTRPQGMVYEPTFDQIALVDTVGRLLLVDGATYQTKFTLYESGLYSAYEFSHDGLWLAVAFGRQVDLWNTQTGELAASIEPNSSRGIEGTLLFSDDDRFIQMNVLIPAPPELRRSENDTSILPWLWDLPSAREDGPSSLPDGLLAFPFFDYRNGLVLGPNDKAIAALPGRLQILDLADLSFPVIGEIDTDRLERDPLSIWFSLQDEQIYIRPINQSNLIQIDTQTGTQVDMPVARSLDAASIEQIGALVPSAQSRVIGQANDREGNPFLRLLLGSEYRREYSYHPLTVTLVDVLDPITVPDDQLGLLIYVLDEQTGRGLFDFVRPVDIIDMAFHPDGDRIVVRRASGRQPIEVYSLDTGELLTSIVPARPAQQGSEYLLTYNETGDVIIGDYQRFDAVTGLPIYQDLQVNQGGVADSYYFTQDSQGLVTISGDDWWLWDLETGAVVRREHLNVSGGSVLSISPDGHRFLIDSPGQPGREVIDIGQDAVRRVRFETLQDRGIADIIPSPDWEYFIIVYGQNSFNQHFPSNEVGIYSIRDGQRWFLAGDDLPPINGRRYGWIDNATAYVFGVSVDGPERIYGLTYHPSGLPLCVVEAFPDVWPDWRIRWEQLNLRLRSDRLDALTVRLCEALPTDVEGVNAILNPSPTPTRPPRTATPAFIAGVPECLTLLFPDQALEYAQEWREITRELSNAEIAEFETLLCEGLTPRGSSDRSEQVQSSGGSDPVVMTIDIATGRREFGSFVPRAQQTPSPSLGVVLAEYERLRGLRPDSAILSPNAELLAERTFDGNIRVYRLVQPYATLSANATATAAPQGENVPRSLAVLPTATLGFSSAGGPRPTMTPTMTPTPPPRADQPIDQANFDETETVCPFDARFLVSDPPGDYDAGGRLLTHGAGSQIVWLLDPATGELVPDETVLRCGLEGGLSCDFSFDRDWVIIIGSDIRVARADGSAATVLFTPLEQPVWPRSTVWLGATNTVEYTYIGYLPERFNEAVTLIRRFDPETGELSEPFRPRGPITLTRFDTSLRATVQPMMGPTPTLAEGGFATLTPSPIPEDAGAPTLTPTQQAVSGALQTELVSTQPGDGPLAVVRVGFSTGHNQGFNYYIYDRETEAFDHFARLAEFNNNTLDFTWHPVGRFFYYRYPDNSDWFVFDVEARAHRLLGDLPSGEWSRDGRYRARWFSLPSEAIEARAEMGLQSPSIAVWDSETGLTRRYCVPGTNPQVSGTTLLWSPDNRYLAFQHSLRADTGSEVARPRTFVLDRATGAVTELTFDAAGLLGWAE
ncbi:MAG: WD40 repeat domain-containing protein [Chloroflexi bacterium]|nr:WD40 repeat domain-containing protein [Chloroflexota bacterium]